MCELSPVTFHGDTIFCIDYQNQPFTPMRPIVENMGLGWASQSQKLNANKERWTVTNIVTVAQDGVEREMLSMPVRKLPAWLNSINPKKVRPELRAKIELYQAESDDALWNYWMNGRAEREPAENLDTLPPSDAPLTPDQQCTLQAIVKAKVEGIPAEQRGKGLYPQIWSRFNNYFRLGSYKQLPQRRMSEAVTYLTQMELTPKALPAGNPQHLFDRLDLSPYEKVLMGPQVRAMLDNEEEVGPRTLECVLLKARYAKVIDEVYRLSQSLAADLRRTSLAGQIMQAVNKSRDFSDPFIEMLTADEYRISELGREFHATAFRALSGNICMAKMLGA